MKLPKLVTGWMTSDKKVHETREEAYSAELRRHLLDALYKSCRESLPYPSMTPEKAAAVIEQHFHIEPKHIEESE